MFNWFSLAEQSRGRMTSQPAWLPTRTKKQWNLLNTLRIRWPCFSNLDVMYVTRLCHLYHTGVLVRNHFITASDYDLTLPLGHGHSSGPCFHHPSLCHSQSLRISQGHRTGVPHASEALSWAPHGSWSPTAGPVGESGGSASPGWLHTGIWYPH